MEANNHHADLTVSDSQIKVPSTPEATGNELEKIRTILFGEQIRSTEDRFAKLEEQLIAKLSETQKVIESRLDALEKKVDDRKQEIDELEKGLDTHKEAIKSELEKVDETLRETIVTAASTVAHDFETKTEALSQALEDSVGQIQKEKVNRTQLADVLAQLAKSLEK